MEIPDEKGIIAAKLLMKGAILSTGQKTPPNNKFIIRKNELTKRDVVFDLIKQAKINPMMEQIAMIKDMEIKMANRPLAKSKKQTIYPIPTMIKT